jgi:hypothetical protein
MNTAAVDRIAKAVLYEGYMLYPYRPSSVKNQQRFNFGVVYPQPFSRQPKGTDPCRLQAECLVAETAEAELELQVRFLQLVERSVEALATPTLEALHKFRGVKALTVDDNTFYSWQEAVECQVDISATRPAALSHQGVSRPFQLPASTSEELLRDSRGALMGRIVRDQHGIDGLIEVHAKQATERVFKVTVTVENTTQLDGATAVGRDAALMHSLVSTHIVLGVAGAEFISLLDPPEALRGLAAECRNEGTFPVLVGDEGQRDTILASPIILYDYPQIAPESAGDLFDGTEIDEILSLRILTMTDEEKNEMRQSDDRARRMLERTENMPAEQFMKLHGALRSLRPLREESQ